MKQSLNERLQEQRNQEQAEYEELLRDFLTRMISEGYVEEEPEENYPNEDADDCESTIDPVELALENFEAAMLEGDYEAALAYSQILVNLEKLAR